MLAAPRGQQIRSQHSHIWIYDDRAASHYRADLYDRKPPKWTWLKRRWQLRISASFYVVCGVTKWHAAIMTIISCASGNSEPFMDIYIFRKMCCFTVCEWKTVSCFAGCFLKVPDNSHSPLFSSSVQELPTASLSLASSLQEKGFLSSDSIICLFFLFLHGQFTENLWTLFYVI